MTLSNPLDETVRDLCRGQDFHGAASALLTELGPDIVRFIHARFRDDQASAEVFSLFAEDLWLGLPKFRFECSLRAWLLILARNAGNRFLKRELPKRRADVPLSQVPELAQYAAQVGTATLLNLATPHEQQLARLRAELSDEEQELLTLRVDRELDFAEIALVTLGDSNADQAAVTRESARLRKRFQLLKERLRGRWRAHSEDP